MSTVTPSDSILCPERWARAPRVMRGGERPHARLYPPAPALEGAVVAVACRDTRGFDLNDAQRLSHFPASPLVCLSWYRDLDAGLVEAGASGPLWRPFGTACTLSGSQSRPTTSWAPTTGSGGMVCLNADAAKALFELDLAQVHDRFLCASDVLGPAWWPLLDALPGTADDAQALALLEHHLAPRWQALRGRLSPVATLRQAGRRWVGRLAWQAREWGRTHSARQVERRIKAYSGRSLREWQSLVKTEGAYFAAAERFAAGVSVDWAAFAHDEGFADQAHLSRTTRRMTGFSPTDFAQRFVEDESFWMYRLWV
ncbi:Transcriptional regulator, AraC family [Paraburkholderia unamae]|uniref:helix-turn-helix domain-containing protein n=1 Tax=Paraburkholderia unamae TaxID=219649 RepID=UPI001CB41CD5|nr:helix-turn-helix domain-containing protein [Paraburkholderia unamae]CAG9275011.1 Transcriptional regulator, AraC family [Paraburkholderia unamae]